MEKHIVAIGNSMGVVIDRALCRMLDVRRGSRVRVTTDGHRLLIEPLRDEVKLTSLDVVDTRRIAMAIVHSDISAELIGALHPALAGRRAHANLLVWASRFGPEAPEIEQMYGRRILLCFEHHRKGESWQQAVARAVAEVSAS
jgi:antitoxin component of MazEF toxin-antitoxin module